MNGHTSPNGGDDGVDADDTRPISEVWHGYDVVWTEKQCPPPPNESESKKGSLKNIEVLPPENDKDTRPRHKELAGNGSKLRQSWKRTSMGDQKEDYGWLRQLDLRGDIPGINEIQDWNFDVLQFEDMVLVSVFIKMLDYYNLLEKFGLDHKTLQRYCKEVMDMHRKDCYYQEVDIEMEGKKEECDPDTLCEYHNWYHAVSCAHVSFLFLSLGGADAFLYPIEIFCIIMGALIHDLDHPGTNNDFEVKRSTTLAQLYDNDAVLERHSINTGLNLCQENPDLDWLKSFDEKDREYLRHFIMDSVLATDPARHGSVVKDALAFVEKGPQNYSSPSTSESPTSDSALSYFNQCDPAHRAFIGRLIIHCADISNPLHSSFEVASDWAIRVTTEFTRQANKEKQLELPVTQFMDGLDSEYKIAKLQIGFFNFMVKPLFNTLGMLFSELKMLEEWGDRNTVAYQAVVDAYDKKKNDADVGAEKSPDVKDGKENLYVEVGYDKAEEGSATY